MVEGERGFTRPVLIPEVIEVHPAPSAIAPAKARVLFSVATTTPSLNVHSPAAIEPNTQLAMSALGRTSIASGLPTICVPCQQQFVKSIINAFGGSIPVPFQLAPYTLDGVCCCNRFLACDCHSAGCRACTHVAVREVWPQRLLDCLVFVCAVGGVVVEGKGGCVCRGCSL